MKRSALFFKFGTFFNIFVMVASVSYYVSVSKIASNQKNYQKPYKTTRENDGSSKERVAGTTSKTVVHVGPSTLNTSKNSAGMKSPVVLSSTDSSSSTGSGVGTSTTTTTTSAPQPLLVQNLKTNEKNGILYRNRR